MSQKNLARKFATIKSKETKLAEKLTKCRKKQIQNKAEGNIKKLKKFEKKEEKLLKKNFSVTEKLIICFGKRKYQIIINKNMRTMYTKKRWIF